MKIFFALFVDCCICCLFVLLNFPLLVVEREFATDAYEQFGKS